MDIKNIDLITERLISRFKKENINAKEYAKYLSLNQETVAELIQKRQLPGKPFGKSRKIYIIPVRSIAIFEDNSANL